jgi:cell division protein FtsQ
MTATITSPRSRSGGSAAPQPKPRSRARRRALVASLVVLALALLAAAGVWLVYFSTVLGTQRVSVVGTRQLSAGVVRQAAKVPLGTPLARQDLDAIARRATSLPAVAAATVTRRWPHTVEVRVTERQPALAVRQPDGYLVVDKVGVGFETRSSVPDGVLLADVNPDNAALLSQVAEVAAALPGGLAAKVSTVSATTQDDITLALQGGVTVTWGPPADSALKAQVVAALLKRGSVKTIDVTSPHNPATS